MKTLSKHTFQIRGVQPNEEPREWHVPKIVWLQAQMDDIPLMYHLGSLIEDCEQIDYGLTVGKNTNSPAARYLRKIRAVFRAASQEGKVYLFQKRAAPAMTYQKPRFEYWSYPVPPR